ncbi:MAG: diguanylate cyclase [Gammaproteobacteria bacterium]
MKRLLKIRVLVPLLTVAFISVSLGLAYLTSRTLAHERIVEFNMGKVRDRLNLVQGVAAQYFAPGLQGDLTAFLANFSPEPDLRSLLVTDPDGFIVASNRISDIGRHWTQTDLRLDPERVGVASMREFALVDYQSARGVIDGYNRVCGPRAANVLRQDRCGFVFYRLDAGHHMGQANRQLLEQSAFIGLEVLIGGAVLVLVLTVLVTQPALRIGAAVAAFSHGDRGVRLPEHGHGELALLKRQLNRMFDRITRGEQLIREKEQRLRSVFESVGDAIITANAAGVIDSVNPATGRLFGYETSEMIGRHAALLVPAPDEGVDYFAAGAGAFNGAGREAEGRRKDGSVFPVRLSISEFSVNGAPCLTALIQDISARKDLEAALLRSNEELREVNVMLSESALTDPLTGLFNRRYFDRVLDEEVRRACRNRVSLSLLVCDVDHFKLYNDHFGHRKGDDCLREVAQEIRQGFQRGGDLVARYGGEEFVVVMAGVDPPEAAAQAEMLRQRVWEGNLPHPLSPTAGRVTISVGVVTYRAGDRDVFCPTAMTLFECADQALYRAKRAGRNRVVAAPGDLLVEWTVERRAHSQRRYS